ncbi:uncharacterized protein LOC111053797 [Nilaparvata lugens]|uniref:uncharacterized protein LOC111053797 n=1 Tax=Nilaparvata lugens TaxID=108931 RepID=UPI00193E745D|nr:uncharacterized protein LOC111053797 [Nilaparvata lugens]
MTHDLLAVCRADIDNMKVIKMVMALPHLPAQRGPPHSDRVPPFSIVDGLNAIIDYINEGEMDARLQNLTAYVRRFWVGVIGVESLSTFGCARRTNNDLESFHAQLLCAFGVNLDIWSFIRRLQLIERTSYDNLIRVHREIAVNRPKKDKVTRDVKKAIRRLINGEITIIHFLSAVAHGADNIVNRPLPQNEWFLLDIAGEEEVM